MPKALLVFRPLNLLILAATQWLIYYFLSAHAPGVLLILTLSSATVCVAAAGNLLNDYVDRERDAINKPSKNYAGFWIEHKLIWPVYLSLNVFAIYLGFLLNLWLSVFILMTIVLMLVYNYSWKDLPIIGNLTIAFLTALSLLLVRIVNRDIDAPVMLYYAMFALFLTWARELVKDLEDRVGDASVGAKNLSLKIGVKSSLMFFRMLIVFVLALLFTAWPFFKNFLPVSIHTIALMYGILCIGLPLIYLIVLSYRHQQDFKTMSNLCKYAMVTGVLSMMFF